MMSMLDIYASKLIDDEPHAWVVIEFSWLSKLTKTAALSTEQSAI